MVVDLGPRYPCPLDIDIYFELQSAPAAISGVESTSASPAPDQQELPAEQGIWVWAFPSVIEEPVSAFHPQRTLYGSFD